MGEEVAYGFIRPMQLKNTKNNSFTPIVNAPEVQNMGNNAKLSEF
jgi:hypothetical protein